MRDHVHSNVHFLFRVSRVHVQGGRRRLSTPWTTLYAESSGLLLVFLSLTRMIRSTKQIETNRYMYYESTVARLNDWRWLSLLCSFFSYLSNYREPVHIYPNLHTLHAIMVSLETSARRNINRKLWTTDCIVAFSVEQQYSSVPNTHRKS